MYSEIVNKILEENGIEPGWGSAEEVKLERYFKKKYQDTLKIYDSDKEVPSREKLDISNTSDKNKKIRKAIAKEDEVLINDFLNYGIESGAIELIDYYTPLILSMVREPFKNVNTPRLRSMQRLIDNYFKGKYKAGYHYISSRTNDIIQEALVGFVELMKDYDKSKGSFSGFIKGFLPYKLEKLYKEILDDIRNIHIDDIDEVNLEAFELKYLSYTTPEKEDQLNLTPYKLTKPQQEVAMLLSEGLNLSQVARELEISRAGVKKHIRLIKKKFEKVA